MAITRKHREAMELRTFENNIDAININDMLCVFLATAAR